MPRRATKRLSGLAILLLASSAPLYPDGLRPHLTVMAIENRGAPRYEAVCVTVRNTLLLNLRLLSRYVVEEFDGERVPPEAVPAFAERQRLDNVIFGEIAEAGGDAELRLAVYDRSAGVVAITQSTRIGGLLEIFDAVDEATIALASAFSGTHLGYGTLVVLASDAEGVFSIRLDDTEIGKKPGSFGNLLNGTYALTVSQPRLGGSETIHRETVTVAEGEVTTVRFSVPAATSRELEIIDGYRVRLRDPTSPEIVAREARALAGEAAGYPYLGGLRQELLSLETEWRAAFLLGESLRALREPDPALLPAARNLAEYAARLTISPPARAAVLSACDAAVYALTLRAARAYLDADIREVGALYREIEGSLTCTSEPVATRLSGEVPFVLASIDRYGELSRMPAIPRLLARLPAPRRFLADRMREAFGDERLLVARAIRGGAGPSTSEALLQAAESFRTMAGPALPLRRVSIEVLGRGTVESNPARSLFVPHEGPLTLHAVPDGSDWDFEGWAGDLVSTANPLTLSVDRDLRVAARFKVFTPSLAASGTIRGQAVKIETTSPVLSLVRNPGEKIRVCARDGRTGDEVCLEFALAGLEEGRTYGGAEIGERTTVSFIVMSDIIRRKEGYWGNYAQSGSLRITRLSGSRISGTFDVVTNAGDTLRGEFAVRLSGRTLR